RYEPGPGRPPLRRAAMTNKTIRDWTIVVAVLAFIGLSTPAADAGLLCAGASTTFDDPRAPQPDDCTRADATALPTYLPPAITLLGAVAVSGVGSLHLVAAAEVSGATPADTTIPAPDDPRVSLGSPGIVGAHAFASFTMNDFVFTGPSGASGVTVR